MQRLLEVGPRAFTTTATFVELAAKSPAPGVGGLEANGFVCLRDRRLHLCAISQDAREFAARPTVFWVIAYQFACGRFGRRRRILPQPGNAQTMKPGGMRKAI